MGVAESMSFSKSDTKLPVSKQSDYGSIQSMSTKPDFTTTNNPVDEILTAIGFGPFQVLAFLMAGLTFFAFACEAIAFSFIFIELSDQWHLNGVIFAITPAVTCLTNIIGEIIFGYLGDKYGRIWPYAASAIIIFVFLVASAFSPNYIIFVILRGITSIGIGGVIDLTHLTLIEFLPVSKRGNITILTGFVQAIGYCASAGLAWWLLPSYQNGWRYFTIATSVPSLVVFIIRLILFVESPRFLVSHQRVDKAWKVFKTMASMNGKDMNSIIEKEKFYKKLSHFSDIMVSKQKKFILSKLSTVFKPPYRRRTWLLMFIFSTQGITWHGSMLFFPTLLKNLGVNPYFCTLFGFAAMVPGIALISIIIEWPEFGRKNTIIIFSASSAVLFYLFAFLQNNITIPVFTVLIFFSSGPMLNLLLTYIAENYPTEIRAMAVSIMLISNGINGMWLPFVSGYLADMSTKYSWLSPTVWGSLYTIQFIATLFLNYETRGKNLQDTFNDIRN